MEQSSSSEANSSVANEEISRILWNLNHHYRVCKRPPLFPVLREINSIYDPYQIY